MSRRTVHPIITQLRAAREAQGLQQAEISQRMYRYWRTLTKWENGTVTPDLYALTEWADLLGYQITLTPKKEEEQ